MNKENYSKTHIKILGVFRMETENFSPFGTRKTLKCAAWCLVAVIAAYKLLSMIQTALQP